MTREQLGLDPQKPTALIMFGGNGSRISHDIVGHIAQSDFDIQTIVMCGRDEQLRKKLAKHPGCHAVPFTDRVADYMRLADFFIGKPGPGSISEAVHMGLPVIVENNARTMIQERYNVTWIEEKGVGLGVKSFAAIATAIGYLLHGNTLEKYQTRARDLQNSALFEIPHILRSILDDTPYQGEADMRGQDGLLQQPASAWDALAASRRSSKSMTHPRSA